MENSNLISRINALFEISDPALMLQRINLFKLSAFVAILLVSLGLGACNDTKTGAKKSASVTQNQIDLSKKWSKTSPAINLHHIFLGEINKRGKPTGFHSRPMGKDPKNARLKKIQSKPNKAGVYTARIEVFDKGAKQWREKFSSMFPDKLSGSEVVAAIKHAYSKRNKSKKQPWSGPSGLGFSIQGYVLNNGNINTAFPVYKKD